MRCEFCQGTGFLRENPARLHGVVIWTWQPCVECHGSGIVSCCEGSARHGQLPACPETSGERAAGEVENPARVDVSVSLPG